MTLSQLILRFRIDSNNQNNICRSAFEKYSTAFLFFNNDSLKIKLYQNFYHIIKGLSFILFLSVSANSSTQNRAEVIHFANQLSENHNYTAAIQEYRRAFFFAPDSEKFAIADKIADSYIANKNLSDAKNFCDTAFFYSHTDSMRVESYLKKITCLIIDEQFGDALIALKNADVNFNKNLQIKKYILSGIANLGLYDFESAYSDFILAIGENDSTARAKINNIFSEKNKTHFPNPILAGGMSVIIPGSGQIYAGKAIEGINSVALLAGITYLGFSLPVLQILFSSMLMRYYMGGFTRAYRYAFENREQHRQDFANKLIAQFPGNEEFIKNKTQKNEFKEFRNLVFDSEKEFPLLISTAFLLYKRILSAQDVDVCVFTPTCSVYMMETIKKHGIVEGLIDGTDRLLRCHGFADHKHYETCKTTGKLYDAP